MNAKELLKKYELSAVENVDYWMCHGNMILKHDAITKIAAIEKIKLDKIESLYQSDTCCRFLITMDMYDKETGEPVNSITSVGEADTKNCKIGYIASLSEKRGIDRCVLKLIDAYQYGIYSDVEAEDFKLANQDQVIQKTETPDITKEGLVKTPITFGKHKGGFWEDLDIDYIRWSADNLTNDAYKQQAVDELNRRNK